MSAFIHLIKFLHQHRNKELETAVTDSLRGQPLRLFRLALSGVETEEALARALYGSRSGRSDKKFLMLKKRLISCLLQGLPGSASFPLLLPPGQMQYLERYQQLGFVRTIYQTDQTAGVFLAEQLIRESSLAECFDILIALADILMKHYFYQHQAGKFERLQQSRQQWLRQRDLERSLEGDFMRMMWYSQDRHTLSVSYRMGMKGILRKYALPVRRYGSNQSALWYWYLQLVYNEYRKDYPANLRLCRRILIRSRLADPVLQQKMHFMAVVYQMKSFLYLEQAAKGILLARASEQAFRKSTYNYFQFREIYLLLLLKMGSWKEAERMMGKTMTAASFLQLPVVQREKWILMNNYIRLMDDRWLPHFEGMPSHPVRPATSRDKRGYVLLQRIAETVYYLLTGEEDLAIARSQSLRIFCIRHLDMKTAERTVLFVRILSALCLAKWSGSGGGIKMKKNITRLRASRPAAQTNFYTVEIIPYELLLERILQKTGVQG